ncbi:MAG: DUF1501 domain-containing protein [Planctomycetes bacterium]|nr:DUF1501 domain-containing protein [Planctomycetota bacterium]
MCRETYRFVKRLFTLKVTRCHSPHLTSTKVMEQRFMLNGQRVMERLVGHGGVQNYGSAFLPAGYQATAIGAAEIPIANAKLANITNSKIDGVTQRDQLRLIQTLNRQHLERVHRDSSFDALFPTRVGGRIVPDNNRKVSTRPIPDSSIAVWTTTSSVIGILRRWRS